MLDFAKRVLAAAWARFAPNAAVDLKGFGSAKRILAAVWVGFAPSGLVEVRGWIRPKRALAAVWVTVLRGDDFGNMQGLNQQNVLWLQPGHVFSQNSTNWHEKRPIGVRL